MDDLDIRIAIAKSLRWRMIKRRTGGSLGLLTCRLVTADGLEYAMKGDNAANLLWATRVPEYTSSLDVIMPVVAALGEEHRHEYYRRLFLVTRPEGNPYSEVHTWLFINATARQYAEAYLKTLGLWVE